MKRLFKKLGQRLKSADDDDLDFEPDQELETGYVEINTEGASKRRQSKILIRPFVLTSFDDVKEILDILREGYTIVLVNMAPLKDTDVIELKRAVNKIKKTVDALDGDIAGFGEDWSAVTPSFAQIHRGTSSKKQGESPSMKSPSDFEEY